MGGCARNFEKKVTVEKDVWFPYLFGPEGAVFAVKHESTGLYYANASPAGFDRKRYELKTRKDALRTCVLASGFSVPGPCATGTTN